MLQPAPGDEPEFPLVGSTGYLKSTGAPRRILRDNRDGTFMVQLLGMGALSNGASLTRTDPREDIFATEAEAISFGTLNRRARASARLAPPGKALRAGSRPLAAATKPGDQ